jgi:hypothetical protein
MLLQLTEPDNHPLDIAISSCYLAKAEHRLGNNEVDPLNWTRFLRFS